MIWNPIFRKIAEKNMTGTAGQKRVPVDFLKKYKIPLPPLTEQKRIAAILDKADAVRKKRQKSIRLLDEFLQSVFLEMFGDPVKNEKGWEAKSLEELSSIISGVTKGRKLVGNEIITLPYLRVANVQDGYIDIKDIKTIEVYAYEQSKYQLIDGDLLLTEGGDPDKLGRGSVWHNEIQNCIHQNHIFRVRTNKKILNPEYLSKLIGSLYGKNYFLRSAKQTTGIATINSRQLKCFPVLLPPLSLQNQFARIVEETEQQRQLFEKSLTEMDNYFNSLMQKAFRGEL
jgi:type I restriction enzyme S subunit